MCYGGCVRGDNNALPPPSSRNVLENYSNAVEADNAFRIILTLHGRTSERNLGLRNWKVEVLHLEIEGEVIIICNLDLEKKLNL